MGNFCILAVFERYLSNAWTDPRLILFVQHNVFRRAPSPSAVHRALGEGELKLKNGGWSYSWCGQLPTISIFLSVVKCGSICRAQTCAHSGIELSRSAKAFYRVAKKLEKNRIFTISRLYVPISQKLLKQSHICSVRKKALSFPYPTDTCVWTHR